jgi:hypothetical protein
MARAILFGFIISFWVSCNQNTNRKQPESKEAIIEKEAIKLAKEYAAKQLKSPSETMDAFGVIIIKDEDKRFRIDPTKIFIGQINDDNVDDALITLTSNYRQDLGLSEQLVMLGTNSALALEQVFELDMKVVKLKDRIITGELHTKPRTSPLYNCGHCIEIANYKYQNGELVRLK